MSGPVTRTYSVGEDLTEVIRMTGELEAFCQELHLGDDLENVASLALDEVLSNVIRHGQRNGKPPATAVVFQADDTGFAFEVSDACLPYNPLVRPDPNLDIPLIERKPGGLGIFLVKKLADEVRYEHREGRNHLWFRKRFAPAA